MVYVGACKTYRKSLSERIKHLSTPTRKKKRIRSLQQRVLLFINLLIVQLYYCFIVMKEGAKQLRKIL